MIIYSSSLKEDDFAQTDCAVSAATASSITCALSDRIPGQYSLTVKVDNLGLAEAPKSFSYTLSATGVSPSTGSFSGGQTVTVSGTGFGAGIQASACGAPCAVNASSVTRTGFQCITPAYQGKLLKVKLGCLELISTAYSLVVLWLTLSYVKDTIQLYFGKN